MALGTSTPHADRRQTGESHGELGQELLLLLLQLQLLAGKQDGRCALDGGLELLAGVRFARADDDIGRLLFSGAELAGAATCEADRGRKGVGFGDGGRDGE